MQELQCLANLLLSSSEYSTPAFYYCDLKHLLEFVKRDLDLCRCSSNIPDQKYKHAKKINKKCTKKDVCEDKPWQR